ncbi:MAG: hypothetical protein HF978_06635 [Desulfobacteraceae bacterium]|nr:hypothetical protein [Desulfobacteraceae bacterium]MBC2755208.1 hypothetical protein [Desulfobacteraceae bacterium]
MIKKSITLTIFAVVLVVIIFTLIGLRSPSESAERDEKKEVVQKQKPMQEEIKVVAIKEIIKKVKPPKRPKIQRQKKQNKTVKVFKPSVKKRAKKKQLPHHQIKIDDIAVNIGRKIIGEKGKIPLVQTSDDHIGFNSYLEKMQGLGGRLFVGDAVEQKIIAEAYLKKHGDRFKLDALITPAMGQIDTNGLAMFRPREIVHEELADEIINKCRKTYGNRDLRCVLMLPMNVEAGILGGLKAYLKNHGYSIDTFDVVWGNYQRNVSGIYLNIHKGKVRNSTKIVDLNLDLSL